MNASRTGRRAGLTLVELSAAVTVGGAAVLLAAGIFASLVDRSGAHAAAAQDAIDRAITRRYVVATLKKARITDADDDSFRGLHAERIGLPADSVAFLTSDQTAPRARIGLRLDGRVGLVVTRGWVVVRDETTNSVNIEYLTARDSTLRFIPGWISGRVLPAAVRLSGGPAEASALAVPLVVPLGWAR